MRTLIVEDDPKIRRDLSHALKDTGFLVEEAVDGTSAWFRGGTEGYDLIILDLTMAGMDGYETFRQLREIKPLLRVILISGFTETEATRSFAAGDLAGFLAKPISEKALIASNLLILFISNLP